MPPREPPSQVTRSTWSRWTRKLRRWLLAGLILIAPAYITWLALRWLFTRLDQPLRALLAQLTGHDIPGAGLVTVLVLITLTGAVASNFLLRSLVRWLEGTLDRIPLVRTLYSGVKQLLAPLADESGGTLQQVVLIRYPDAELYALGFLIKADAAVTPDGTLLSAVLVPSNHLHLGNVVLCPLARIFPVDLNAEDGLRFLVSMGAALSHPMHLGPSLASNPAAAPDRAGA